MADSPSSNDWNDELREKLINSGFEEIEQPVQATGENKKHYTIYGVRQEGERKLYALLTPEKTFKQMDARLLHIKDGASNIKEKFTPPNLASELEPLPPRGAYVPKLITEVHIRDLAEAQRDKNAVRWYDPRTEKTRWAKVMELDDETITFALVGDNREFLEKVSCPRSELGRIAYTSDENSDEANRYYVNLSQFFPASTEGRIVSPVPENSSEPSGQTIDVFRSEGTASYVDTAPPPNISESIRVDAYSSPQEQAESTVDSVDQMPSSESTATPHPKTEIETGGKYASSEAEPEAQESADESPVSADAGIGNIDFYQGGKLPVFSRRHGEPKFSPKGLPKTAAGFIGSSESPSESERSMDLAGESQEPKALETPSTSSSSPEPQEEILKQGKGFTILEVDEAEPSSSSPVPTKEPELSPASDGLEEGQETWEKHFAENDFSAVEKNKYARKYLEKCAKEHTPIRLWDDGEVESIYVESVTDTGVTLEGEDEVSFTQIFSIWNRMQGWYLFRYDSFLRNDPDWKGKDPKNQESQKLDEQRADWEKTLTEESFTGHLENDVYAQDFLEKKRAKHASFWSNNKVIERMIWEVSNSKVNVMSLNDSIPFSCIRFAKHSDHDDWYVYKVENIPEISSIGTTSVHKSLEHGESAEEFATLEGVINVVRKQGKLAVHAHIDGSKLTDDAKGQIVHPDFRNGDYFSSVVGEGIPSELVRQYDELANGDYKCIAKMYGYPTGPSLSLDFLRMFQRENADSMKNVGMLGIEKFVNISHQKEVRKKLRKVAGFIPFGSTEEVTWKDIEEAYTCRDWGIDSDEPAFILRLELVGENYLGDNRSGGIFTGTVVLPESQAKRVYAYLQEHPEDTQQIFFQLMPESLMKEQVGKGLPKEADVIVMPVDEEERKQVWQGDYKVNEAYVKKVDFTRPENFVTSDASVLNSNQEKKSEKSSYPDEVPELDIENMSAEEFVDTLYMYGRGYMEVHAPRFLLSQYAGYQHFYDQRLSIDERNAQYLKDKDFTQAITYARDGGWKVNGRSGQKSGIMKDFVRENKADSLVCITYLDNQVLENRQKTFPLYKMNDFFEGKNSEPICMLQYLTPNSDSRNLYNVLLPESLAKKAYAYLQKHPEAMRLMMRKFFPENIQILEKKGGYLPSADKDEQIIFLSSDRDELEQLLESWKLPDVQERVVVRKGGQESTDDDAAEAREAAKAFPLKITREDCLPLGEKQRSMLKEASDKKQYVYFYNASEEKAVECIPDEAYGSYAFRRDGSLFTSGNSTIGYVERNGETVFYYLPYNPQDNVVVLTSDYDNLFDEEESAPKTDKTEENDSDSTEVTENGFKSVTEDPKAMKEFEQAVLNASPAFWSDLADFSTEVRIEQVANGGYKVLATFKNPSREICSVQTLDEVECKRLNFGPINGNHFTFRKKGPSEDEPIDVEDNDFIEVLGEETGDQNSTNLQESESAELQSSLLEKGNSASKPAQQPANPPASSSSSGPEVAEKNTPHPVGEDDLVPNKAEVGDMNNALEQPKVATNNKNIVISGEGIVDDDILPDQQEGDGRVSSLRFIEEPESFEYSRSPLELKKGREVKRLWCTAQGDSWVSTVSRENGGYFYTDKNGTKISFDPDAIVSIKGEREDGFSDTYYSIDNWHEFRVEPRIEDTAVYVSSLEELDNEQKIAFLKAEKDDTPIFWRLPGFTGTVKARSVERVKGGDQEFVIGSGETSMTCSLDEIGAAKVHEKFVYGLLPTVSSNVLGAKREFIDLAFRADALSNIKADAEVYWLLKEDNAEPSLVTISELYPHNHYDPSLGADGPPSVFYLQDTYNGRFVGKDFLSLDEVEVCEVEGEHGETVFVYREKETSSPKKNALQNEGFVPLHYNQVAHLRAAAEKQDSFRWRHSNGKTMHVSWFGLDILDGDKYRVTCGEGLDREIWEGSLQDLVYKEEGNSPFSSVYEYIFADPHRKHCSPAIFLETRESNFPKATEEDIAKENIALFASASEIPEEDRYKVIHNALRKERRILIYAKENGARNGRPISATFEIPSRWAQVRGYFPVKNSKSYFFVDKIHQVFSNADGDVKIILRELPNTSEQPTIKVPEAHLPEEDSGENAA